MIKKTRSAEPDLAHTKSDSPDMQLQQIRNNDRLFKVLHKNYLMMVKFEEKETDLYGREKPKLVPDQFNVYDIHTEYDAELVNIQFGLLKNELTALRNLLSDGAFPTGNG